MRELACHLAGMTAMASDPGESARQRESAGPEHSRRGGPMIDSITAVQVRERAHHSPDQVVAEVRRLAPLAAAARAHAPADVRERMLPEVYRFNGVEERWTVGYLVDVILTRDCFMHRIDLARATGKTLALSPEHDGVIVDDIVREWAERHGSPYRLALTGPAGGQWSSDLPGEPESIRMDAIELLPHSLGPGDRCGAAQHRSSVLTPIWRAHPWRHIASTPTSPFSPTAPKSPASVTCP